MKYDVRIIIASVIVASFSAYASHFNYLRKITGWHCEEFGCARLGEWITELVVGAIFIPLIFGIFGYNLAREKRMAHAVSAFVISLVWMLAAFTVVGALNRN